MFKNEKLIEIDDKRFKIINSEKLQQISNH
jgi:hypothetical protein